MAKLEIDDFNALKNSGIDPKKAEKPKPAESKPPKTTKTGGSE